MRIKILLFIIFFTSGITAFTQPLSLVFPNDSLVIDTNTMTFRWNAATDAVSYDLQIASDNIFTINVTNYNGITQRYYTDNTLTTNKTYFWHIRSFNGTTYSDWSDYRILYTFSPPDLSGLKLWLRPDIGITLNGSNVSNWADQSGNLNDASQSNGPNQPSYSSTAFNGKPLLSFNGSSSFLNGTTIPNINNSSMTVLSLFSGNNVANNGQGDIIWGINDYSNGIWINRYVGSQNLSVIHTSVFGNALQTLPNSLPNSGFPLKMCVFTKELNTSSKIYINDTLKAQDGSGYLTGSFTNNNYYIGFGNFTYQNYYNGNMGEIIIYDNNISDVQRKMLEEYIRYKYVPPVNLGYDTISSGFCSVNLDAGSQFQSWLWSTGETSQIISADQNGLYWVRVTDIFGFFSYDTIQVSYPVITLTDTFFCSGNSVTLSTGLGGGYTYLWSTSETTSSIDVDTADFYSVTVTDGSSCTAVSPVIYVSEDDFPATANLGPPTADLCSGNSIGLIAPDPLPPGLSYSWQPGGEVTPTIAIYVSDTYTVTITDSNGCSVTDAIAVNIAGTAPDVHFTAVTACAGDSTQFTNTSTPQGTIWLWDFDDGQTSTDKDPKHVFTSGGDYTVNLFVDDGGCSNDRDSTIHIPFTPTPSFSYISACIGTPYSFNDQSIPNEGNIISWYWDFGDPSSGTANTSTLQNPSHTYDSAIIYTVTLIVTNDSGCQDSVQQAITVASSAPAPGNFSLYLPSDSLVTTNAVIDFAWNTSINAVTYTLEYSTDPYFAIGVTTTVPGIFNNYYQDTISTEGIYYWHVIAVGVCGDSTFSNTYLFSIFSPESILGLVLWLKSDSIDTTAGYVNTWYDCSGNGNHAVQSTQLNKPELIPDFLNNYPVLRFDGTYSKLTSALPINGLNASSISSFIIANGGNVTANGNGDILFGINDYSNGLWINRYTDQKCLCVISQCTYGASLKSTAGSLPNTGYNFRIFDYIKNLNVSSKIYINKTGFPPITDITQTSAFTNDNYYIGHGGFGYQNFYKGDFAEIIIFDEALSTDDRQNIENYLHFKYAPPVNLGPDIWSYNFCSDTLDASDRFISYAWSTGDTTSSIEVYSGDTIWVDVVDVFGFPSSDTVIVHKPIVTANSDTLCLNDSTTLHSGLNSPYITGWAVGSDTTWNEAYTIHAGDTVDLILEDTVGCTAVREVIMTADSFPLADLLGAPTISICSGDTIFAQNDTGQYVTYNWFDGTNNYSTPYYVVPASWVGVPGNTLTLTCTNLRGCSATDILAVSVPGQNPLVGFTATAGCEPFLTQFTDTSIVLGINASKDTWIWSYGDGDSTCCNDSTPSHNFDDPGIHLVTLTIITNQGCSESVTDTTFVYSKPDPSFSPLLGCTGVPYQFNDQTTSILGSPASWSWDFGDPYSTFDTSTQENPVYTYDSVGYDTVHFVVVTEYGCTDSIDQVIFIRPSPDVGFSYTDVCDGNPVYFTNETEDPLGIYQMYWDFGNGNIYTITNPVFTFDGAGTYPVTLHVQSINGCIVDYTDSVVVHAIPDALFIPPDDICLGYLESLIDSSSVLSPDSIAQWEWDFGNLGISYDQQPVINFPTEGDFPVILTVTSNAGCTDSYSTIVHVNPVPTASFLPDEFYGESPFTVNFSNSSQDAWAYFWNFGDTIPGTSTLENPGYTYTYNDTFTVMLVATNEFGCSHTTYHEMYVFHTDADVAVDNVTTQQQGEFLTVSADIWNYGSRRIYELYLYAKASGGTTFMESWSDFADPLAPNDFIPYTFFAQFAVPEGQVLDYVCVEAQIKNYVPDDHPENNEECITFNNNFTAFIPYPAPSNDEINIDYILPFNDQVEIDLYDIEGRLIKHIFSGEGEKGLNKLTVDISDIALAVYVYRITFNEDFRALRFVKY